MHGAEGYSYAKSGSITDAREAKAVVNCGAMKICEIISLTGHRIGNASRPVKGRTPANLPQGDENYRERHRN